MPLYEYECTACHRRTEKRQKFSDPEITVCPYCNGHLERVLSAPAVSFKGGGWYADGYGNAKPKSSSASESKSPSSSADSNTPSSPTPATAATAAAPAATPAASSDKK
ncbi:MAG TPA: zinc ribbon domain-containing protein [Edaphobacter sp.]|nr:zinc ribbon domain-containing protein [Edaphobacter sp.]